MALPPLILPGAARLKVSLTGGPVARSTTGYRQWRGQFQANEPIVALAMTIVGSYICWTRTSHRGTASLQTSILFAPHDEEGSHISVSFSILDAYTVGQTVVDSLQTQPCPTLQSVMTGELVQIATIGSQPVCELKALFLARRDVASVRNGVWHTRAEIAATLAEPWLKILTYGRTGTLKVT